MKLTKGHRPDYFLVVLIFVLTVAGLVILTSASSDLGKVKFNDSYYYIKHQILSGLIVGVAGFGVAYFVNYQKYKKWAFPLLLLSLVLLVLVFTPLGLTIRQTNRWLQLGPVRFQPAEIMKLTFIIYLAAWLSNSKTRRDKNFWEGFVPLLLVFGLTAGLLVMQPATSTVAILLGSGLVVYYLSGAKLKYIFSIIGLGIAGLAFIILITPYRMQRILTYINGQNDTQGSAYHINQALIAIGSGGVSGVGFGQSTAKMGYLPTPVDDSIFAVVAQELGFIGAGVLIALFWLLALRLYWLARGVRDRFGRLLLIGFGTVIAFQSLVNMASISGVLPLTGVPLPFVSYGGTALAVFLTMMGISTNVSRFISQS
jgi:cell division protein FtsW